MQIYKLYIVIGVDLKLLEIFTNLDVTNEYVRIQLEMIKERVDLETVTNLYDGSMNESNNYTYLTTKFEYRYKYTGHVKTFGGFVIHSTDAIESLNENIYEQMEKFAKNYYPY